MRISRMRILFTPISGNAKTGPIPVSGSPSTTCPRTCPFAPKEGKPNGCYADYGPISWHWSRLDKKQTGIEWKEFLVKIKQLPRHTLWRHNQFGDLKKNRDESIDREALAQLTDANKDRRGFTYTHHVVLDEQGPKIAEKNRWAISEANKGGFAINLSGNNIGHADKLKALNIAPVVCVVPHDTPNTSFTPAGNKIIVCPNTYRKEITCAHCRLCAVSGRSVIIGFKAHGMGARHVEAIANAA